MSTTAFLVILLAASASCQVLPVVATAQEPQQQPCDESPPGSQARRLLQVGTTAVVATATTAATVAAATTAAAAPVAAPVHAAVPTQSTAAAQLPVPAPVGAAAAGPPQHPAVGSTICVQTAVVTAMPTPLPVYTPPPPAYPAPQPYVPHPPISFPQPGGGFHPAYGSGFHPGFNGHFAGHPPSTGSGEPPLQTGFDMHLNLLRPECEQALVMLGARMSEDTCSSGEQEDAGTMFDKTFAPGASAIDFHMLCQDDCVQKVLKAADDVALSQHCQLQASQSRFSYLVLQCPRGKWGHGISAGTVILGVAVACLALTIVAILWRYHLK